MIGYNRLGTNGRLGNQMFQYAALRGIAANNNLNWCIPPENTPTYANYGLFDCFKLKNVEEKNLGLVPFDWEVKDEPGFEFDEVLFNNCPDNVNIDGYRQSEKYFKHIEDQIREDYEFIDSIKEPCLEFTNQFNGDLILLHIRRGDNVGRPDWYPMPKIEHYEMLLEKHFHDNQPVLICSDDVEWVRGQKIFESDRFYISEQTECFNNEVLNGVGKMEKSLIPYIDLCLMSLCSDAIIANSSLSWWGAWLQKNPNKKIIAQSPWFGERLSFNNVKDLIPENWIIEPIAPNMIQQ